MRLSTSFLIFFQPMLVPFGPTLPPPPTARGLALARCLRTEKIIWPTSVQRLMFRPTWTFKTKVCLDHWHWSQIHRRVFSLVYRWIRDQFWLLFVNCLMTYNQKLSLWFSNLTTGNQERGLILARGSLT